LLSCVSSTGLQSISTSVPSPVIETFTIGKPVQKAEWDVKPNIRICASTELLISRVGRAVVYWERLGYKFDDIYKDYFSTCMSPKYGEIIITIPSTDFGSQHMASTRIYTSNKTGKIVMAKIYIIPKNGRKERVLEHELGHALGWSHYNQKTHIMHPTWRYGGYDSFGLRKR